MRRIVLLMVIALLAVGATTVFATGTQPGAAAEPLIWYVPGGSGFPYNETEQQAVHDAFNELVMRDLGTTVDIRIDGNFSDYNTRMPLILASGEKMDIVWTATWNNNFLQNAADGFYAGLDDLLEEYGQDILADIGEQLEATRIDGEIRAIWSQQIAAHNAVANVRMDFAEKYGWDVTSLESPRDIEPWLAQLKQNEPEVYPFLPRNVSWDLIQPYYSIGNFGILRGILGIRIDDPSLEVLDLTRTSEFREWIDLMREWQLAGYIPEDGLTYSNDQWTQLMNQARYGVNFHNTYNPQLAETQVAGYTVKSNRIGEPMTLTSNILSTLHAIHVNSEQKETAMQFLNWLWTNQEGYNLVTWGLEGRHYEVVSDGEARTISPIADSGYYTNLPWMWGNTFQSYLLPGQKPGLFDEVARLNRESRKANVLGFNPDAGAVDSLVASVSAVADQFYTPLMGGWVEVDKGLADFQAALDRAGFPELVAAMQEQVDAWAESNR